ncbi:GNAT family N-acetyltransferase [Streptococcus mutans]|uniref:GNAT family N-acetyltransferase n=1 Tax=Streptococcus mutans TaxID=1309 RepID=UPI0003142886|nr:N-acetyltransferase [Streptococcus mutans]
MQVEIRKVNQDELSLLQKIAIQTFRETFAFDNTAEQLQNFFDEAYTLSALKLELADKESETYFILMSGKAEGFLKVNWGSSQTEQVLEDAFEIQRLYILKAYQGQGLGKQLFEFALERAQISGLSWVWLGVWEKNVKAQLLYAKYGFEQFSKHSFFVGNKVDTDWLLKKSLS